MPIERYIAQKKLPHFSGTAKAANIRALTETGEADMWGSVGRSVSGLLSQTAGHFATIARHQYAVEASLESGKAIGTLKQAGNEILGYIEQDTIEKLTKDLGAENMDAVDLQKQLGAATAERLENVYSDIAGNLPNEKARNIFEGYWQETLKPLHSNLAQNLISKKFTQHLAAEGWTAVELMARAGDVEGARKQVEALSGVLTPGQKNQLKTNVLAWAAAGEETEVNDFIADKQFDLATATLDASEYIPSEDVIRLQNKIRTNRELAENEEKSVAEIYVEQAHKSTTGKLATDPNDTAFLDELPKPLRDFWQEKLNKRATQLEEQGIDTFNQYDPILLGGLKQQIREDPTSVAYMDIVDAIGAGLMPEQAQELFALQDEMQRKDSPLSQPHVKRAHDRINDLQNVQPEIKGLEAPTAKSTPEEIIQYMNVFDEMHALIDKKASKDVTPAEMRQFTEELVKPVTEEHGKSILRRFWEITPVGFAATMGGLGYKIGTSRLTLQRKLRKRPKDRNTFEETFKKLYEFDPDMADSYWERWNDEI